MKYLVCIFSIFFAVSAHGVEPAPPSIRVEKTADFPVTGDGSHSAWESAVWTPLAPMGLSEGSSYSARFKVLHSETGLYVLFEGTDTMLTATLREDFSHLWEEDVFEIFLWTDEAYPVYFEYEISPLGTELPILVPNLKGKFLGWRPWDYEGERKVRKATQVMGGPKEPGAKIEGWRAEVFIPYALLAPLGNVPPKPGTAWRVNVYRIDRDEKKLAAWSWAPVEQHFHEFERFGRVEF
ncbi:MAG: carbohydrate-binding family 9-like protein [Candidatus Hydrogenedentes bacterium]|nr:carbohydrate-binding family 9-like protein [Candidatus Hydrogenedentota bacterium]